MEGSNIVILPSAASQAPSRLPKNPYVISPSHVAKNPFWNAWQGMGKKWHNQAIHDTSRIERTWS
jgi:hypothetical protein